MLFLKRTIRLKDEIEISRLARKVLSFFGLELRWTPGARQIWVIDAMTCDLVKAYMELPIGGLFEKQFKATRAVDDYKIASIIFIEALGSIKIWSYGRDIETLAPKKILDNPFFKYRSLEEIAVKLDLLAGETKR